MALVCGFTWSSQPLREQGLGVQRGKWPAQGLLGSNSEAGHSVMVGPSQSPWAEGTVRKGRAQYGDKPCQGATSLPPRTHLSRQGWELQASTTVGCGASALHRAGGKVLRTLPWASTQRTTLSRRPPPQDALHAPKSPAAQLRRRGKERWGPVPPRTGSGEAVRDRQICPADWLPRSGLGPMSLQVPGHCTGTARSAQWPSGCPQAAPEPKDPI